MPDGALLMIHAITSLHAGSGTALGVVDMPVQRERHTLWPTISGSAVKGVLRDACRERVKSEFDNDRRRANEEHTLLTTAFGPGKIDQSDDHAGAVSPTDARILAFPVRSAKGTFAWVTCPGVLERLSRDAALISGLKTDFNSSLDRISLKTGEAIAPQGETLVFENVSQGSKIVRKLVLEEFDFECRSEQFTDVVSWIIKRAFVDEATQRRAAERFVILADDDFTHFVRNATEVSARIALDYETKTVKNGALFYQEFLPPETVLYSLVSASEGRKAGTQASSSDLLKFVEDHVPPTLQFGGDETTGKGICSVRFVRA